jgi:hypothetical protein
MNILLKHVTPLIGTHFTVQTGIGPVELQLAAAEEIPRRGRPAQFRTPLSLLFEGPAHVVLQQDTYGVSHPALGEHLWCIVPVTANNPRSIEGVVLPQYEVLFS